MAGLHVIVLTVKQKCQGTWTFSTAVVIVVVIALIALAVVLVPCVVYKTAVTTGPCKWLQCHKTIK